jgi:2-polyprenyl-3-methyl-5-hydroxy-6-metoxy-1,4-benzoquinol methylase
LYRFPETADIETSSEDYARRFSGPVGQWFLNVQERATLRMLAPYRGGSILDVGGGHGQITEALLRSGYRVTILGSSENCRRRIDRYVDGTRCFFQVGNILELPFPERAFDVVISYRLIAHVTRWTQALSEFARVAAHSVMIDYPSTCSLNCLAPQLFTLKRRLEGNTRRFTSFRESQLLEVFESCGFKKADRYPQFFLPMVLHRVLKLPALTAGVEQAFRSIGATRFLGSPVILKTIRKAA